VNYEPTPWALSNNPSATYLSAFIAFSPASGDRVPEYFVHDAASSEWLPATKSALKKAASRHADHVKKMHRIDEEEETRQAALIEARKFVPHQDDKLPAPVQMKISARRPKDMILGSDGVPGTRVKVIDRVDNIRSAKTRSFVYPNNTRGELLCIFEGKVNAVIPVLQEKEATMGVIGEVKQVPPETKLLTTESYTSIIMPSLAKHQEDPIPSPT
jgi:hypothetical protein